MTLHLVSEARPFPWERLNDHEKKWIREADKWMKSVIEDAKRAKPTTGEIDQHKSGRVLFIDGPRGAGKTSLLLTLLQHWRDQEPQRDPEATLEFKKLHVLLPILDFDPLPHGMPLHGWLLEPWRSELSKLDKVATWGAEGKDLIEMWSDVFERVVLGWSQVSVEGKGVAEKALAYREQSSGWVDTHDRWYDLVNAAVCRKHRCSTKDCKAAHPDVFIIAIDDVDLQVEQVPYLIHAIRLLHHPNVVYVLTGDMAHLRFVVELDYIRQHSIRWGAVQGLNTQEDPDNRDAAGKVKSYSRTLRDALIEKAIPSHATLSLSELTLAQILGMRIDVDGKDKNVADQLDGELKSILELEAAAKLRVATARRAQHAIDKHLRPVHQGDTPNPTSFFADLCGTSIDERKHGEESVSLRGRLTTQFGPVLRTWEGDRLQIKLGERADFEFDPFDEGDVRLGADANRVAIAQLAVEGGRIKAPALEWRPVAGIMTTEVEWKSGVTGIAGTALFHWPWLNRPTVPEVLEFAKVAEDIRNATKDVSDRINLPDKLLVIWLKQNIIWQYKRREARDKHERGSPKGEHEEPKDKREENAPPMTNLCEVAQELSKLCNEATIRVEAQRWAREIAVMAAPYFGLPEGTAEQLLIALRSQNLLKNFASVVAEEKSIVENAIIAGQEGAPGGLNRKSKGSEGPNAVQFDNAVTDFLAKRKTMSDNHEWWKWKDASKDPTEGGAPQSPGSVTDNAGAEKTVAEGGGQQKPDGSSTSER